MAVSGELQGSRVVSGIPSLRRSAKSGCILFYNLHRTGGVRAIRRTGRTAKRAAIVRRRAFGTDSLRVLGERRPRLFQGGKPTVGRSLARPRRKITMRRKVPAGISTETERLNGDRGGRRLPNPEGCGASKMDRRLVRLRCCRVMKGNCDARRSVGGDAVAIARRIDRAGAGRLDH